MIDVTELFPGAKAGLRVSGVSADSRAVAKGDLFVAVPGAKADGKKFAAVDPARCAPGKHLVLVFHNEDGDDYDVSIDPGEFIEKHDAGGANPPPANPTSANAAITKTVPAFDSRQIRLTMQAKGNFGKQAGQLRYTTYKYTVHGQFTATGVKLPDLDPDFDITP